MADRRLKGNAVAYPSRGFSIVEMLVAVLLISIGSLAALTMQRAAVKQNNLTDARETAAWLARQLIENTRMLRYYDASLATTNGFQDPPAAVSPTNPLNALGQNSPSGIYTRKWQIDSPEPNIKRIQVQITWNQSGQTDVLILKSALKAR
jgi:type IV pilus modification protein PilV